MARRPATSGKIDSKSWPPDMPEFMRADAARRADTALRADAGKYVDETKPEDIAWAGEEFLTGGADRERGEKFDAIKRTIFNSRYALRLILSQIICHHPVDKRSDEARLDAALNALLGPDPGRVQEGHEGETAPEKPRGGRKELADENLLRIVAREYLRDTYGFSEKRRTVTELYRAAIYEAIRDWRSMSADQIDKIRRRLANKFTDRAARDRIMIEYTGSSEYEARRYIDLANRTLPFFRALGLVGPTPSSVDKTE